MGPYYYKVKSIGGDYAYLVRTDIASDDEIQVALALLPDETDIGTELVFKDLEYSLA